MPCMKENQNYINLTEMAKKDFCTLDVIKTICLTIVEDILQSLSMA